MNYDLTLELVRNGILNDMQEKMLKKGNVLKGIYPNSSNLSSDSGCYAVCTRSNDEATVNPSLAIITKSEYRIILNYQSGKTMSELKLKANDRAVKDFCYHLTIRRYEEDGYYFIEAGEWENGPFLIESFYDKEAIDHYCRRNKGKKEPVDFPSSFDLSKIGLSEDSRVVSPIENYEDVAAVFNRTVTDEKNFIKIMETEMEERKKNKQK